MQTPGPLLVDDGEANCLGLFAPDLNAIAYLGGSNGLRGRDTDEDNAFLLAAAYTSYDKHCGERATECAEGDLLGKLLEVCQEAVVGLEKTAGYLNRNARGPGDFQIAEITLAVAHNAKAVIAKAGKAK